MAVELMQQPVFTEAFERRERDQQTIFDHYSIDNEAQFLREAEILPAEKNFYVRENIMGFLGEYVGKIPYKKITYVVDDNKPYFAGLDVLDSYWKSARVAGYGSRVWDETVGIDRVLKDLIAGQHEDTFVNSGTIVSPPKDADYGFVFHFANAFNPLLQKNVVEEYILRYDEEKGSVHHSRQLAQRIAFENLDKQLESATDLLQNPLFSWSTHQAAELDRIERVMGFDQDALRQSQRFEDALRGDNKITAWIETYIQDVTRLSNLSSKTGDYMVLKNESQLLIAGIYNRARDIQDRLEHKGSLSAYCPSPVYVNVIVDPMFGSAWEELRFYATKRLVEVTGGSCPTVNEGTGLKFLSVSEIMDGFKEGKTVQELLEQKTSNTSESKKPKCPECGWEPTAEQLTAMREGRSDAPTKCPDCGWDPCTKSKHA